ncbi:MAG TPA: proton-conducting transporter membrane subunit [Candidatus Saccharimonadales bacterium]
MLFITIVISFIIAALVPVLFKNRRTIASTSLAASFVSLAASVLIARRVAATGSYSPSVLFTIDALAAVVMLVVSVVAFMTAVYSVSYFNKEMSKKIIGLSRVRQYYALVNLFVAAMFMAAAASHPVTAWIFLEATTLSTAFLISFYNRASTIEAAWKYLIINAVGLLLAFLGTLLYFTAVDAGSGFVSWQALLDNVNHLSPDVVKIAFVFVLVGYGTKIGLAPMHTWKPDTYSKSPAPLGALLSSALMPVAFAIMLRFKAITDVAVGQAFSQRLLIVFGLLSILIAAFSILTVKNYKRLLAYSSIEHAGIMMLGFGFGGIGPFAALLHMIYHSFIKSSLFFTTGNLLLKYHSAHINKIRAAISVLPATSALFFVGLFAITGFPPFGIFLTELSTLSAGTAAHKVIVAVALFAIAVVFIGFFRQASRMIFSQPPEKSELQPGENNPWLLIPPIAMLVIVLVITFYMPPFVQTLIHTAVARY